MYLFFCNTPPACNHHLQLRLRWAITMHKSQGQTLDKAVIDLGPNEACTGLTFVCLSRAKRLVDFMVEPMSFDRIGNLGNYVPGIWKLRILCRRESEAAVKRSDLANFDPDTYAAGKAWLG